jgi:hypothetical protein
MAATVRAQFRKMLNQATAEVGLEQAACDAFEAGCRIRFAKMIAAVESVGSEVEAQKLGVVTSEGAVRPAPSFFQLVYGFEAEGWEKTWLTFTFENKAGTDQVTVEYASGRGRRMTETFNFRQMDRAVPYVLSLATSYFGP